jgi:hypothetical protein
MTKKLLREYFELCPDGNCVLDVLTEGEKKSLQEGAVFLVGICQRAGVKNGNGRIYRKPTLQREVERYQELVNERRALGELDHPDDSVVNLKNVSHLMTKMWWDGDNVMCKIEVMTTPSGQVLRELIKSNVKLGISSRGLGSVKNQNGETIVEDDFKLIAFDMVSDPSTPEAWVAPERTKSSNPDLTNFLTRVSEGKTITEETHNKKMNNVLDDILKS